MRNNKHPLSPFKIIASIVIITLILIGTSRCDNKDNELNTNNESRIIIFHINDLHGQIDNLAKIAWVIEEEKINNPNATVLFFNAGDNFSGNPVVDQYEPKGEPVLQLLNHMKCDVMALGNHEFDYGQKALKNFIKNAGFPVLCANATLKGEDGNFPQLQPYTILKSKNGEKIAILSLIQIERRTGLPSTHPARLNGFTFDNPLEVAPKYRNLKDDSDIFIALTHLGSETDAELAQQMGELDIIIGGHSHTRIHNPIEKKINGVLIAQAGSNAKYLGRIELVIKNNKIIKKEGKLIKVATLKNEIPKLKEMIAGYINNPLLEKVIATLPRTLKGINEVGNFTTDALRKYFQLDIVFHNSGGLRSNRLNQKVKLKDLYSLHPFQNRMVRFNLNVKEIKSLIRNSYEDQKRLDLLVSGIDYIVRHTPGGKVVEVELMNPNGEILDESKSYTVGINDYMASTYEFSHRDPGTSLMVTVNEALIHYLKENKEVCQAVDKLRTREIEVENN